VIVSSNKLVRRLSPPIPLELLDYGLAATLARLGHVRLRDVPRSPDGGVIADYLGEVDEADAIAARLSSTTGVLSRDVQGRARSWRRACMVSGT
jgi:ribose 5-phosphate isomerase A